MEKFKVTAYNGTTLDIVAPHVIEAAGTFVLRTGLHLHDIKSIVNVQ